MNSQEQDRSRIRKRATVTRSTPALKTVAIRRRSSTTAAQSSLQSSTTSPATEKIEPTKSKRTFTRSRGRNAHSLNLEVTTSASSASTSSTTAKFTKSPNRFTSPKSTSSHIRPTSSASTKSSPRPTSTKSFTRSTSSSASTKVFTRSSSSVGNKISTRPTSSASSKSFVRPTSSANIKSLFFKTKAPALFASPASSTQAASSEITASFESTASLEKTPGLPAASPTILESSTSPTKTDSTVATESLDSLAKIKGRRVVVPTRKKLIEPSSVESTTRRPRITGKKLIAIRPTVDPTSTLPITATELNSTSLVQENFYSYETNQSEEQTPDLYLQSDVDYSDLQLPISLDAIKIISNLDKANFYNNLPLRGNHDTDKSKVQESYFNSRVQENNYSNPSLQGTIDNHDTSKSKTQENYYNNPSLQGTIDNYDTSKSKTQENYYNNPPLRGTFDSYSTNKSKIQENYYNNPPLRGTFDSYDTNKSKIQENYFANPPLQETFVSYDINKSKIQDNYYNNPPLREAADNYDTGKSKVRAPDFYSGTYSDNYYSPRITSLESEKVISNPEKARYYNDPSLRDTNDNYYEGKLRTPQPRAYVDNYYSSRPTAHESEKIIANPEKARYYGDFPLRDNYDTDESNVQTPDFYPRTYVDNYYSSRPEAAKIISKPDKPIPNGPVIITDNFFFPGNAGVNENQNKFSSDESSDFEYEDYEEATTVSELDNDRKNEVNGKLTGEFQPIEKTTPLKDHQSLGRIKSEIQNLSLSIIDRELHKIKVNERLILDSILNEFLKSRRLRKMKATDSVKNAIKATPSMTELSSSYAATAAPEITGKKPASEETTSESRTSRISSASNTSPLPITPEEIEASLADDLYLSLSQPDLPQIESSIPESNNKKHYLTSSLSQATPVLETSVYYSETIVTSTRLRTYTYVVTKLNGLDTEVTSSTTVRPRVTTLTLTVPVTLTVTPTLASSSVALNSLEFTKNDDEDSGRRFNLATRVMSNGVEVIVAGTTPAYRWENSNPQPTLTLSEAVVMMLPQDKPNEFVTKTCTTTFTYLNTITRNGTTIVSTDQQVIANTATEERHRKPATEAASVTLEASPTLQTEIFKTTYTYLTLNTDHPDEKNALGSSTRVIANTITAPQYYLDMILEPSEAPRPETHTYYSTRVLEKTYVEEGKTKIEMTNDVVTQLIITESAPPSRSSNIAPSTTIREESNGSGTDVAKTYYITYTYYNTYLEKDSTVVKTNIATSSDIVYEKAGSKKTSTKSHSVSATPEPIQIFATKTYLTTYTYFTTLLQAGSKGETSTTVSSRTQIVENVITESIAPSLLDAGYMNALMTTSQHSDTLKNVVTGSTIIFFDDEEPIAPTTTFDSASTSLSNFEDASTSPIEDAVAAESNDVTSRPVEPDNGHEEEAAEESTSAPANKKPSQVSNLLSLGSLGINSLSALGPVFSAMAGLLQGKNSATRRNDSEPATESPITTTQRSPIYIPVAEFVDGDIETAESQNIGLRLASSNHLPETRHKVTSSLADGIPISPGEIITANSDVIIGRPGKMGPRPPQTYHSDESIGMKPPPVSVPNVPVHPVLEVLDHDSSKKLITVNNEALEIYPAHQIYEDHINQRIKIPQGHSAVGDLQQTFLHAPPPPPPKTISSKQDILENDPLLIPPNAYNANSHNRKSERNKHPWSPKDPITASNILVEDKHQVSFPQKEYIHTDNIGGSKNKLKVPEPIIHQVPHVIDRSTGQPLLVNIQPSQVANVIIPQGGTQALIFGDTNEPHISGQYFDDPSPYPEPEVGPGFIGIDKVENLPQYSKKDNPTDYMTPPSLPNNLRPSDNNNHNVGQGHVHTEILVHHGVEGGYHRPQNKPPVPSRNHQNVHFPPRREHTNVHIPVEQTPPRRTEVPLSTENLYYDKKPQRNPQTRWPRPTIRPRPPSRISGRPHGRPPTRIERPVNANRQPPLVQGLPNVHYQNEFNKPSQYPSTVTPLVNQQTYPSGSNSDQDKTHYENYDTNSQSKRKNSVLTNQDYIGDEHPSTEFGDKIITVGESHNDTNYVEKVSDSEVDASENVKIITEAQNGDDQDFIINPENSETDSSSKYEPNEYFISNVSSHTDNSAINKKPLFNSNDQIKTNDDEIGDIIIGSEKKQDHYLVQSSSTGIITNQHNGYQIQVSSEYEQKPVRIHDTVDLNPPAIIPPYELNGHSRPFSNPQIIVSNSGNKTKHTLDFSDKAQNVAQGHILQGLGQVIHVQTEKKDSEKPSKVHKNEGNQVRGKPRPDYTTQVHPNHPQIITKLKPQVPGPVTIFSDKVHKQNAHRRPTQQFSLPIDSIGEENESKTQTERAPSSDNKVEESLDTAFQTNFASTEAKEEMEIKKKNQTNVSFVQHQEKTTVRTTTNPISQDMKPPPVSAVNSHKVMVKNSLADAGLRPPPPPSTDVLGLSPPPVDITTTSKPVENKPKKQPASGLKPPPLYIPLKESKITPSLPSTSMVPPNVRPSVVRPYLADILSQDMIPPPPEIKTTQTLEAATARPGVEVSGSIQIATAVAASHIPVMQDSESKIPIVHGTVDLPVVIDVPEFLKPIDTKAPNHVSVYTVLPFETKQRNTIKPTISPSRVSSTTIVRQSQVNRRPENSHNHQIYSSSRLPTSQVTKKPNRVSEFSIILEPSTDVRLAATRIEPTKSLTTNEDYNRRTKQRQTPASGVTKTVDVHHYVRHSGDSGKSYPHNASTRKTDLKIKESASKMMEIIGTVVHEFIQNSTNEKVETKPQEVTRFETLTVTRTETSVLGSPPTTRTLLITHTLTSTSVETVTETLLRPTSVISTITSTILHPITRVPAYENDNIDNESIFVVMSEGNKPPVHGAEEVEAEYGDEDVSRDEQDTSANEIHRVLSGGIAGAPSVPIRPPKVHCLPECKASKSEICAELRGEMHCVCRPGFSRMFPDRPCKPTYTYTVSVGLDRFGRDRFVYHPTMNDSNSVMFRRYAHPLKEALDRTLMQSDLRDALLDLSVVKFLSDPARVLFNVQLSSNTEETRLADVIRKYLMMSNYSIGMTDVYAAKDLGMIEAMDFDECATEENGPHHDCSPHAVCFNLKGTYQCSCKEGWADLSENSAYPGRHCSQAPLGCSACNNNGHCVVNSYGQELCECFPWHAGKRCQFNLKLLLIGLVSSAVLLMVFLVVCVGMACFRNPNRRGNSADRRAMISGMAGNDSSSETSVAELAIPHHVPHILPPPPQMLAPAPPMGWKQVKKIAPSHKQRRAPRKAPAPMIVPVPPSANDVNNTDQRDRSLTVMIPRAKYRSTGQTPTQLGCKPMSTFSAEEHKLIDYLEGNSSHQVCGNNRKTSFVSNSDYKDPEPPQRYKQQQANFTTTASGALVSAGFQVSATVTTRGGLDPSVESIKADLTEPELETRIQAATVGTSKQQMLRLDFAEAGSTLARSCGETTIQPPTKIAERKGDCRGDSASEGHTMAERDLGSTLRLPTQHALYAQDRTTSSDRESNFDSL